MRCTEHSHQLTTDGLLSPRALLALSLSRRRRINPGRRLTTAASSKRATEDPRLSLALVPITRSAHLLVVRLADRAPIG